MSTDETGSYFKDSHLNFFFEDNDVGELDSTLEGGSVFETLGSFSADLYEAFSNPGVFQFPTEIVEKPLQEAESVPINNATSDSNILDKHSGSYECSVIASGDEQFTTDSSQTVTTCQSATTTSSISLAFGKGPTRYLEDIQNVYLEHISTKTRAMSNRHLHLESIPPSTTSCQNYLSDLSIATTSGYHSNCHTRCVHPGDKKCFQETPMHQDSKFPVSAHFFDLPSPIMTPPSTNLFRFPSQGHQYCTDMKLMMGVRQQGFVINSSMSPTTGIGGTQMVPDLRSVFNLYKNIKRICTSIFSIVNYED